VSSEKDKNDQGAQEVFYWALALVGLIAIKQLWSERLRPWIEGTWGQLRAGELVNLPIFGRVDRADAIGIAVLAAISLIALGPLIAKIRHRRHGRDSTSRSY
jgi:hypothetical protein